MCQGKDCSCTCFHEFRLGKYRHYKGSFYDVTGLARCSETLTVRVEYQDQNGERWQRPLLDNKCGFVGFATVEGVEVERFVWCPDLGVAELL